MSDRDVKPGIYLHFSGNRYQVTGFGHQVSGSGTQETPGDEVVVYHALFDSAEYGERHTWVRTVANFTEEVEVDGSRVPRFRYVGPA